MRLRDRGETKPPEQCDGCGATPPEPLEARVIQGVPLVMCVNPTTCRLRAQARGRWMR